MKTKSIKEITLLMANARNLSKNALKLMRESGRLTRDLREVRSLQEQVKLTKLIVDKQKAAITESMKANSLQKEVLQWQIENLYK